MIGAVVVVLNGVVAFLTFTAALAGLAGCCRTRDRYPFVSADHNYLQIRVFRHEKKNKQNNNKIPSARDRRHVVENQITTTTTKGTVNPDGQTSIIGSIQ